MRIVPLVRACIGIAQLACRQRRVSTARTGGKTEDDRESELTGERSCRSAPMIAMATGSQAERAIDSSWRYRPRTCARARCAWSRRLHPRDQFPAPASSRVVWAERFRTALPDDLPYAGETRATLVPAPALALPALLLVITAPIRRTRYARART